MAPAGTGDVRGGRGWRERAVGRPSPPRRLPADGGCVQGAAADGHDGCQPGPPGPAAARASRPRHTPARTLLTARTCPAAQKVLAVATRPGLPAAPAALLVCLPASAPDPLPPSLSALSFSPFFFSSLPVSQTAGGEGEGGERGGGQQ